MKLLSISLRNVRLRLLSTALTTTAIALATGLYAAIMLMVEQTRSRYEGSIEGYRAIVGAKGSSELELVLNTIFNVGTPRELVRLRIYEALRDGRTLGRRTQLLYVIPQARGDVFSKYRFPVIGTTDEMWSKFERKGRNLSFAAGRPWAFSHEELVRLSEDLAAHLTAERTGAEVVPARPPLPASWREAVIGSRVARRLGLSLGDRVVPSHGAPDEIGFHAHEEASCTVVGILEPTNSPLDSSIFIPLGTYALLADHEDKVFVVEIPPGKNPDDAAQMPVEGHDLGLTAIIAYPKDHFGPKFLRDELASRPGAQGAWPQEVVPRFLRQIGNAADVLVAIAWLVLLVAAVLVLVSIYNTMNERRREIAIMRSLGARRHQILSIIVGEAALLSASGAVLGVLACHLAALWLGGAVEEMTGVYVDWLAFRIVPWPASEGRELYLVLAVTGLGALAGLLPAIKGSMTQVADNLTQNY
ncbi:MAG: ABC transporter permease [Planctomycetota bacterium]